MCSGIQLRVGHLAAALSALALAFAGAYAVGSPAPAASVMLLQPSDPQLASEWRWPFTLTHLDLAWEATTGGSAGPLVAVIDTGVAPTVDLAGRVESGKSYVGGEPTQDSFGHGTMVAGLTAGAGNNGQGVAGVCWGCRILPLRVVGADGLALNTVIAEAIDEAVRRGARVINVSLGSNDDTPEERAAVERAIASGVLVVAAAGNGGSTTPMYPAAYPGVLSVGSVDSNGNRASFSNYGSWVNVFGPECSSALDPASGPSWFCGTSASSPFVTGLAGLLLSLRPDAGAGDVAQALRETARPADGAVYGIVDAAAAVARFGGQVPSQPAASPAPAPAGPAEAPQASAPTPPATPAAPERVSPGSLEEPVTSTPSGSRPVQNVVPPTIVGPGAIGSKLSATSGRWKGVPKRMKLRWERCFKRCIVVKRTTEIYLVTRADAGKRLRVVVTAVARNGRGEKAASRLLQIGGTTSRLPAAQRKVLGRARVAAQSS